MTVEAFIICWNEEDTIELTIRHYQKFCEKITIYDNYSTDRTGEISRDLGCSVQLFGIKGVLDDTEYLNVKNNCWKGAVCDWVVVCDSDEILWRDDISDVLIKAKLDNHTLFRTYGFNVYSMDMPKMDFLDIVSGVPDRNYSKRIIFSPELREIGFVWGCHEARHKGRVSFSDDVIPLLHYRNIGGPQRLIDRHAMYRSRMSKKNLSFGLGVHYLGKEDPRGISDEERANYWMEQYENKVDFDFSGVV